MIFMRALACIELEMMLFMRNLFLKSLILWSAFDLWAIIASQCWMFSRKQGCLTWYTSHTGCYVLPTFETESFSVLLSPKKFPEILKYWDIENDRIWPINLTDFLNVFHELHFPANLQYTVTFFTSEVKSAGTDATISITLVGSSGSKEFRLRNQSSNHIKAFLPGQ